MNELALVQADQAGKRRPPHRARQFDIHIQYTVHGVEERQNAPQGTDVGQVDQGHALQWAAGALADIAHPEIEVNLAVTGKFEIQLTRIQLAIQLSQVAQYREALEHLLTVLKADKDFNDGEARKVFLDTLATIGKGDPLAAEYQRKLFSLMY